MKFKVVTFNILNTTGMSANPGRYDEREPLLRAELEDKKAHVIALQEVNHSTYPQLKTLLPDYEALPARKQNLKGPWWGFFNRRFKNDGIAICHRIPMKSPATIHTVPKKVMQRVEFPLGETSVSRTERRSGSTMSISTPHAREKKPE